MAGMIMARGLEVRCGRCEKWERASGHDDRIPAGIVARVGADHLRGLGWSKVTGAGWVCPSCKGKRSR